MSVFTSSESRTSSKGTKITISAGVELPFQGTFTAYRSRGISLNIRCVAKTIRARESMELTLYFTVGLHNLRHIM